ncbi:hypothetical protein GBF38_004789 [Nibea albiflora]|uniref:Uncharacterized protein n=1 Tax=Nibea albiflora TaxID=240163 RepID=A0ACB7FDA5_NIBAL|nr:hypothetical protein GBF38_004789 [Nibea albiflora]
MPAAAGQASACLLSGRTHKYLDAAFTVRLSAAGGRQKRTLRDANMVPLRLVAFALLAAAWYLTRAAEVGSKIKLEHILYKVGVGTRCGEGKRHPDDGPDTYCSFPWAEMVVEDLCANKKSCEVPVTERVFGEYPCKEQTRYLEVSYSCATPPPPPPPPPPPTKPDCMYIHTVHNTSYVLTKTAQTCCEHT